MHDSTIDRPARDALAALIANHLRGSIHTIEAHQRACENRLLVATTDPDILALAEAVAAVCSDLVEYPEAIGAETRAWLARVIVFLRSDLHLRRIDRSDFHPRQIVGAAGILLAATGVVTALYLESWVVFVACWAAAGTLALFYQRLYSDRPPAGVEALGRYAPFRSESQLRASMHLVGNEAGLQDAARQEPRPPDADLGQLALGAAIADSQATVPRIGLSWFLFGPLYGTMYLPGMLRCEKTAILLVDEEPS